MSIDAARRLLQKPHMDPAALSRDLRRPDPGRFLTHRRYVASLSLLGTAALGVVALHQLGVIPHLPEPALPQLSSDRVTESPEAYERLQVGDGFIGAVSYALTFLLTGIGASDRAAAMPAVPLVMAGKVFFDGAVAARLTASEWRAHRVWCAWCLVAAAAAVASVPLVIPEARAALTGRQR
jgi:hypothetical protein